MKEIIEILDSIEQSSESEYPRKTYRLPDKDGKTHRAGIPYICKILKQKISELENEQR